MSDKLKPFISDRLDRDKLQPDTSCDRSRHTNVYLEWKSNPRTLAKIIKHYSRTYTQIACYMF